MRSILRDSSIFKSDMREKKNFLFFSTLFYVVAILVIKNIANKYYFYDVGITTLIPKLRMATSQDFLNDPYFYFGTLTLVTYAFLIKAIIGGIEEYSSLKNWYILLDAALLNDIKEAEDEMRGKTFFKEGGHINNLPEPFIAKDIVPFDISGKTYGEALQDLYLAFQVVGFANEEDPKDVSYNIAVNVINRGDDDKSVYKVLYFDDKILFLSKHLDISYDLNIDNLIQLTYSSEEQLFGNMLASINALRVGEKFSLDDLPGLVTISQLILNQVSETTSRNEILITKESIDNIKKDIDMQTKGEKSIDK